MSKLEKYLRKDLPDEFYITRLTLKELKEMTEQEKLTNYVMAERCMQVEIHTIYEDYKAGNYDNLTYILEGGFKGFKNMEPSELIEEYKAIEDQWYDLESTNELHWEPYEDDPINKIEKVI